jgi:hypothetical protein
LEFFFGRRDPNYFLLLLVAMDEIWLYRYDQENGTNNNQWSGGITARPALPQKFRVKIR